MSHNPMNPKATREAKDLLKFLYSTYMKTTLTGQHNQMFHMSEPSLKIQEMTGKYPLIWGGEWGFSDERHDIDNIKYRPRLLDEIRAHHKAGQIIVMTYHQASPTIGEPCDFRGGVQVKLKEQEWEDILTSGTKLHQVWEEHIDRLAEAFKTLQREKIPVVFRPYHEMNGGWFWWGGDAPRFKRLWAMIYDRYTHFHKLNNLLWAWNPDKPLALSEISEIPTPESLAKQPWAWFMGWDSLTFSANKEDKIKASYASDKYRSEPWQRPQK